MKDNNENNMDETLDNVTDTQELQGDALDGTEDVTEAAGDALSEASGEEYESDSEDGADIEEDDSFDDGEDENDEDGEDENDEDDEDEDDESEYVPRRRQSADSSASFVDTLKNLSKKQLGCIAALAVVVIAVIVVIIVLATGKKDKKPAVNTNTNVTAVTKATEAPTQQETTMAVVEPEKDVSFDELQSSNEDIYAYIYVPGTDIDYPILQSESRGENYYLNYTVNHYYSWTGAIYTQFTYNKQDFSDKNTIIYGHAATHNINSVMFTQLHYYEDEEFLKQYPYIYIYQGDRQLKYQIFAAVHFTDVLIPAKYGVNDGASMVQFVNDAKTTYGGVIDDSVVINEDSKIITLSTCTMVPNYDDNKRFLVIAKLVEESKVAQ